jgi:hypothetical protein
MPGHLARMSGEMVHPRGQIAADLHFDNGHVHGTISLPGQVTGTFRFGRQSIQLQPGTQSIRLPDDC